MGQSRKSSAREYVELGSLFLPNFWLAYRKMYKLFIILTLLAVPSIIVTPFIDIPDGIYLTCSLVLQLGTMIFTGWQGNRLYYKHAVRVLHKEKIRQIMRRRITYNQRVALVLLA